MKFGIYFFLTIVSTLTINMNIAFAQAPILKCELSMDAAGIINRVKGSVRLRTGRMVLELEDPSGGVITLSVQLYDPSRSPDFFVGSLKYFQPQSPSAKDRRLGLSVGDFQIGEIATTPQFPQQPLKFVVEKRS